MWHIPKDLAFACYDKWLRHPLFSRWYLLPRPLRPRCSLLQPLLQRPLALARRPSSKEPFNAEVFVEIGPMNSFSCTDHSQVIPLLSSSVGKPRIPGQRGGNCSAIRQFNGQLLVCYSNVNHMGRHLQHSGQANRRNCSEVVHTPPATGATAKRLYTRPS